jgi:AAA domain-containing protein/uncharacterized protein DUF3854
VINGAASKDPFARKKAPALPFSEINGKLSKRQLQYFKDRGINADLARQIAAQMSPSEYGVAFGQDDYAGAVLLRYRDLNGNVLDDYARARHLGDPVFSADREMKFRQPSKSKNHLFLPPMKGRTWTKVLGDTKIPITVCEGETRAAVLAQHGEVACAIGGVWSWFTETSESGTRHPIPELVKLVRDREVTLAFDHDATTRPDLQKSIKELGRLVTRLGGRPLIAELPDLGDGKTGLDDLIAKKGFKAWRKLPRVLLADPKFETWGEPTSDTHTLPDDFELHAVTKDWISTKPADVEFVIGGLLPIRNVGMLVGQPGIGKTFVLLSAALAVATGSLFFGLPTKKGRVVFLSFEDQIEYLKRRVYYMAQDLLARVRPAHVDAARADLSRNLFVGSVAGQQVHLVSGFHNTVTQTTAAAALGAKLHELKPDLVCLGPLSRMHGLQENDNTAMTAVTSQFEYLVRHVGCAVLADHHSGKGAGSKIRGASAIEGVVRSAIELTSVDSTERSRLQNIPPEAASADILKLTHEKSNNSAKARPIYLYRADHGVLKHFAAEFSAADAYAALDAAIRAFYSRTKKPFTCSQLAYGKRPHELGKKFSRAVIEKHFAKAQQMGDLVPAGTRKGGSTFIPKRREATDE